MHEAQPLAMALPSRRATRRQCRRAALFLLTLALAAQGVVGTVAAQSKAATSDPPGDTLGSGPDHVDITRLAAAHQGGDLVIDLSFAGAISAPDSGESNAVVGFIDLDTDRNAATGGTPFVDFLTTFESDLGNELYVSLATYRAADGMADLVAGTDGATLARVPVTIGPRALSVRIPQGLIGGAAEVHTAAVVGTLSEVDDAAPNGGFVSSATAADGEVLLNNDRFRVEIAWRNAEGDRGTGTPVFQADDSAVFWFFDARNWEFLVKVLNGCALNNHYWVFAAATTDVEYTLTVTDTQNGAVQAYTNPLGLAAAAITDTSAFATCP